LDRDGNTATIGFRVRTARATAVLLAGSPASPRVLGCRALTLYDPAVPESRQPYHAALGLPEAEGRAVVRRAGDAVRVVAIRAVGALAGELRGAGHALGGIGLVVGSNADPARLGNAHVRAHASEGRLFREVLEAGALACGARCLVLLERDAYTEAAAALGKPVDALRRAVAALRPAAGPWRAEEKTATLAAWMLLE
jgi:hypothetical protein